VQAVLEAGPAGNLKIFLDALQQLEASNDYLQKHNRLAAVKSAVQHTQAVFNRALEQCDADFGSSLLAAGRSGMPGGAWLRSSLDIPLTGEATHSGASASSCCSQQCLLVVLLCVSAGILAAAAAAATCSCRCSMHSYQRWQQVPPAPFMLPTFFVVCQAHD
jgi:hypothetical protein